MTYTPITTPEVDAESPIDDLLMGKIADNFADHEARLQIIKSFALGWHLNGDLSQLWPYQGKFKRLDGVRLVQPQTFSQATMLLEQPGLGGTLEIDIRKYRSVSHPIINTAPVFSASINTIARAGSSLSTQSISRAASSISTQSITLFKAALSISNIVLLGSNLVRYNFSGATDSDWKVGDTVTFASATNAANNGSFTIVRVNDDGGNNVVITNASGVAQTSAAGTGTLRAYSYNYTNPVSTTDYVAGRAATFASHTNAASDGTKTIYAVNSGGNNIVVKDPSGVAQGGAAGTASTNHWVYSYASAVSTTDYVVGEFAQMASHTNANNNGAVRIVAVNSGGNNIVVYNSVGVAQGSAAGNANTNRWVYALSANPTGSVLVGQPISAYSASNSANNGNFTIGEVNRGGTNNIVVYNINGVAQGSAAGGMYSPYTILSFASDQSAFYNTRSNVEVQGFSVSANNGFFDVVEVNRGGGANYNIVVNNTAGASSVTGAAGRVVSESKSIFSTTPKIVFPTDGSNTNNNTVLAVQTVAAVFDVTDGTVTNAEAAANVGLGLDIVQMPTGYPENLTVQLA